jgi:Ca2+-transporting ATPase
MKRPPRDPNESLFAGGLGQQIVWVGLIMGLGTIGIFGWAQGKQGLEHGQTAAFFVLTIFQMFSVLGMRSERNALWTIGFFSNPKLISAVVMIVALQLAITYSSVLQPFFHTTALTMEELALCLGVALTVYLVLEGEKWLRYRGRRSQPA